MAHPKRRSRSAQLSAAIVAVILLTGLVVVGRIGWNYYERHRTFSPTTALSAQCDEVPPGAQRITLTGADGVVLGAAVLGPSDAAVGLVIRQGASQKICEWLPWAGRVAAETGTRVLLFDRRGRGSSPAEGDLGKEPDDTRIAVDYLRASGTPQVAVAASSMGNSIMFSALPDLEPAPCAVLAISPVLVSGDANGIVDGSGLRDLPENVWVTWEEGNPGVVANATRILAQARSATGTPNDKGVRARPDSQASPDSQANPDGPASKDAESERNGPAGQAMRDREGPHALAVDTDDHSRQLVLNHSSVQRFFLDAVRSCS